MIPEDGMNGSVNVLNEIGAVLSQHHRGIDSEDIKSALIELLKATRSADSNDSGFDSKLKNRLPTVLAMLKHSEVSFFFSSKRFTLLIFFSDHKKKQQYV